MTRQRNSNVVFTEALDRIREVTGLRTQVELAGALGIRQSSVSDAKRRGAVPGDWLVTLLDKFSLAPAWVVTGLGPRYLVGSETPDEIALGDWARPVIEPEPRTLEDHVQAIQALAPHASVRVDITVVTEHHGDCGVCFVTPAPRLGGAAGDDAPAAEV